MFANVFIVLGTFLIILLLLFLACNVIEMIWVCVYACFSPFMCPNRQREPWIAELCLVSATLIIYIDNILFKYCGLCCGHINIKLKRCKRKIKLCKICVNKKLDKIKVKPIIYDDVHIIVVNPHNNNYQIATVSKIINT